MDQNAVRKEASAVEAKRPNATSFGPEETEEIVMRALHKDRKMKQG